MGTESRSPGRLTRAAVVRSWPRTEATAMSAASRPKCEPCCCAPSRWAGAGWTGFSPGTTINEIARREGCTKQHVANNIPLAFLAPDVICAIIDARLPRGISARRIAQPELEWARQWEMLGIRR